MNTALNDICVAGLGLIVLGLIALGIYSFFYWIRHGEQW